MADNFNVKQFLAENKLGPYSRIKEGEAAYEYEKGKAAGEKEEKAKLAKEDYAGAEEEKMMDFLAEYEVIYVVENGRCYRITDEGYKDEVDMSKCRMYAEAKKEKEEGYMGTQYDSSEDMAVDMIKKGITEKPTEEAMGGKNPEGDALVLRFLQGVAKKFDYPVAKAAIFVKDTIKSLGY